MRRLLLASTLLCGALALAQSDRPSKNVPALRKAPKIDGQLKDLKSGFELTPSTGPDAWSARVSYRADTLYLGVSVGDDTITNGDIVKVTMFFPGAGTTAQGTEWRFAVDGLRPQMNANGWPTDAMDLTRSEVKKTEAGMAIEASFPARALPRFPAKDPMVFELCVTYEDRDKPAESPVLSSNCESGTMKGDALRLPEDFRRRLKLKPFDEVIGIEGRKKGWVGYAVLHYPVWAASDEPLTATVLRSLVAENAYDPKKAGINLPDAMLLPGGSTVLSVLSGKNPYEVEGKCEGDRELRFALYLVKGRTAERVLEWPASSCALGRAAAFELDEEGELTVGYTLGSTATFVWSKDHFERTEVGSR